MGASEVSHAKVGVRLDPERHKAAEDCGPRNRPKDAAVEAPGMATGEEPKPSPRKVEVLADEVGKGAAQRIAEERARARDKDAVSNDSLSSDLDPFAARRENRLAYRLDASRARAGGQIASRPRQPCRGFRRAGENEISTPQPAANRDLAIEPAGKAWAGVDA